MTNEQNKQQGQHDQTQQNQQGQNNPTGSVNPTDKSKTNPSHEGGIDPKNPQDVSKKDPSRGYDSTERQDQGEEQGNKRRAS
jgi:hypothetical protein